MENLNKLSYTQYKINESIIEVPMEEIVQQYDDKKFATKPYLFKILYIGKYIKKTNEYTVYLGPLEKSKLPIIKATIPLEIIRTNKIIPGYDYSRPLEETELFILKERIFRKISDINEHCFDNRKYGRYYILCYGYLVNQYKDDDAMTKREKGVQQFRLVSNSPKKIRDRNYETTCYVSNKLSKILEIYKLPNTESFKKFKELPEKFFVDKKK